MAELPDRRVADCDRRDKPGAGYGKAASLDPHNQRVEIRRWYKNRNRGRPQPVDDQAMTDWLGGFTTEGPTGPKE